MVGKKNEQPGNENFNQADIMKNILLQPIKVFENGIHYGWVLFLFMAVGALIGYFVVIQQKPVFQTQAVYSVVIDYSKTGKMTDTEEDQVMGAAGEIFLTDSVVNEVLKELDKVGLEINEDRFRKLATTDRTNQEWILTVRAESAVDAGKIIKTWTDVASAAIKDGLRHAGLSSLYQHQLTSLVKCVEQVPSVEAASPVCGFESLDALHQNIQKISQIEKSESENSLGLITALKINLVQLDKEPNQKLGLDKNLGIITGAFIGFLFFILALSFFSKQTNQVNHS